MKNLDKGLNVTKAQKFWILLKKGFIGCLESVFTGHGIDLEPSDWDH